MIFQQIKASLTIKQVVEFYGVKFKRGKALCPIHGEKTPSFVIYDKTQTFQCMGCRAGGDIITFVSKMFGLSNFDAAKKLDHDFNLGLTGKEITREDKIKWKRYQDKLKKEREQEEKIEQEKNKMLTVIGELDKLRIKHKPRKYGSITDEFICFTNAYNQACMMYEYKIGAIN